MSMLKEIVLDRYTLYMPKLCSGIVPNTIHLQEICHFTGDENINRNTN